jgi:pimeloyl-ACP methyl ester carboxylesterase
MHEHPNVVLVHGAFADGSSWSAVTKDLQAKGYAVVAPQFPLTSLADDVARLRQVLTWLDGPAIVVGHSYGGQIMTALGADTGDIAGLVYIAAFGLDEGESIAALGAEGPPPPALANIIVDERGFGRVPEDDFVGHFAADVDPATAKAMHAAQQPVAMSSFGEVMGTPAWKSLPSWYLVAENDEAIAPDAERLFAQRMGAETAEVASSHVPMVSHPHVVVDLIEAAAREATSARAQEHATA